MDFEQLMISFSTTLSAIDIWFFRIVDNMPITWCYEVADSDKKYCSTGFPIGCSVTGASQPKDACVISVSPYTISLSSKQVL